MPSSRATRRSATVLFLALGFLIAEPADPVTSTASQALRLVKGRTISVRSAEGEASVKALLDLEKQEDAAALAARTVHGAAGQAPTPTHGATTLQKSSAISALYVDGIHTVNNKGVAFVVFPGGKVTIKGHAFGDTWGHGQANAIGQFPGGAVSLRIIDWHDDEIDALFPPGLAGVLDSPAIVQVITNAGKIWKLDGGKFIAEREEIAWTTNIDRLVKLRQSSPPIASLDATGMVERFQEGYNDTVQCWSIGGDEIEVLSLGRGFAVVGLGAECGRTDTGNTAADGGYGQRTFHGAYEFRSWDTKPLRVAFEFGVWHNHKDKYGSYLGMDQCLSLYQLSVTVSGPKGVPLF